VDDLLAQIRCHISAGAPRLLPLFDVMAGEARFARAWLDDDLRRLPSGSSILEVGGGVFLLSCQLAREGFAVTTVEPIGVGFNSFQELGATVLTFAARNSAVPVVVRRKAEDFTTDARFALAFSVNVMEHIEAPDRAIQRVSAALLPGASYRFLCPNYLFPYEPHFNIPALGGKSLTHSMFRRRIEESDRVEDPVGLWKSLNWITVPQVKRMVGSDASLTTEFRTSTLAWVLDRAVSDREFARRRAGWIIVAIRALRALRVLRLASLVPAAFQPIMDVRLTKSV